jgi:flagellin
MAGITLSAGVRQSLSALQSAASQQSTIQNRLATGKKVNSALDNPANFFTSSGLSNRANDLSRLMDDMGQAVKTLQAADKGLSSITKLVENAQSIAKQAQAVKREASALTTAGSTAMAGADTLDTLSLTDSATVTLTFTNDDGTTGTVVHTVGTAASEDVNDLLASLDGGDTGNISAKLVDGKIEITDKKGRELSIDTSVAGADGEIVGTFTGGDATENKRATLQEDYDALMTQIDQLAKDASYNGVNLLDGDNLDVQFNENGSSKLGITGASINATALSIDTAKLDTNENIKAALTSLKSATDELRSQASTFGSNLSVVQNRQDFTKGMIDTLQAGSDALVVADPNEEGANLLALQTRAQLASTTLSMASQQDQAVLRLF